MRSPRLMAVAVPVALTLGIVALACSNDSTGLHCDPTTILPLAIGGAGNGRVAGGHRNSGGGPGGACSFTLTGPTRTRSPPASGQVTPGLRGGAPPAGGAQGSG